MPKKTVEVLCQGCKWPGYVWEEVSNLWFINPDEWPLEAFELHKAVGCSKCWLATRHFPYPLEAINFSLGDPSPNHPGENQT